MQHQMDELRTSRHWLKTTPSSSLTMTLKTPEPQPNLCLTIQLHEPGYSINNNRLRPPQHINPMRHLGTMHLIPRHTQPLPPLTQRLLLLPLPHLHPLLPLQPPQLMWMRKPRLNNPIIQHPTPVTLRKRRQKRESIFRITHRDPAGCARCCESCEVYREEVQRVDGACC